MTGPYVVGVRNPRGEMPGLTAPRLRWLAVRAVATLGEAHALASSAAMRGPFKGASSPAESEAVQAIYEIGPEGGKVSLPDGSEIEVEARDTPGLWLELPLKARERTNFHDAAAVRKAWNAEHGIEAQD